jgi:hypothetical protein
MYQCVNGAVIITKTGGGRIESFQSNHGVYLFPFFTVGFAFIGKYGFSV